MDEKGVQVMTETGTMSAKGSIVTDCHSLLYTGVKKEIFFTFLKAAADNNLPDSRSGELTKLPERREICRMRSVGLVPISLTALTQEATDRRHRFGKKMYFLFSLV
jgi:hypothetical protein